MITVEESFNKKNDNRGHHPPSVMGCWGVSYRVTIIHFCEKGLAINLSISWSCC